MMVYVLNKITWLLLLLAYIGQNFNVIYYMFIWLQWWMINLIESFIFVQDLLNI